MGDNLSESEKENMAAAVEGAIAVLTRIAHIDLDTAEATHTEAGSLFSAVSAARAALAAVAELQKEQSS